jgi:hypothetical protein
VVQQIWDHHEQARMPPLQAVVGDGRREVGLATTVVTQEDEPSIRVLSKLPRAAVGLTKGLLFVWAEPIDEEAVEGHARQQPQVAGLPEIFQTPFSYLVELALARDRPAEVRVVRVHIPPEIPRPATDRADLSRLSA